MIVLVEAGRKIDSLQQNVGRFRIMGHHQNAYRTTIKQPMSCVWETFPMPWVFMDEQTGDWLYLHPSSELMTEAVCCKHKWLFGATGFSDTWCDYGGGMWGNYFGLYLWNWPTDGAYCFAEWNSSESWDGDDPVEADYLMIKCGGFMTIKESPPADNQGETYCFVHIADDLGNYAYLFLFIEPDYVLQEHEHYVGVGRLDLLLSNYGIYGKITEVRIEAAAKSGSSPTREVYFYIYEIDLYRQGI